MTDEKKKELIRILKFTLFSISAGVIEFVSCSLLDLIPGIPYWVCYLTGLILSVLWNFTFNRNFTFKASNNIPFAMFLVALFYLVFTPVSTILGNYLVETLGWISVLVTLLNMLANFVLEYLYDRFVVFRNSIDTKEVKK